MEHKAVGAHGRRGVGLAGNGSREAGDKGTGKQEHMCNWPMSHRGMEALQDVSTWAQKYMVTGVRDHDSTGARECGGTGVWWYVDTTGVSVPPFPRTTVLPCSRAPV